MWMVATSSINLWQTWRYERESDPGLFPSCMKTKQHIRVHIWGNNMSNFSAPLSNLNTPVWHAPLHVSAGCCSTENRHAQEVLQQLSQDCFTNGTFDYHSNARIKASHYTATSHLMATEPKNSSGGGKGVGANVFHTIRIPRKLGLLVSMIYLPAELWKVELVSVMLCVSLVQPALYLH